MAGIVKSLGCVSVWVILISLGSVGAAESSSGWKAGVARVDTTPSNPVRLAGYASRTAPSQGVAHPLAAKALALEDARDHKVVFVTCDIIAFRRAFTNRVTERVKAKYGLPREDVVLFASHNHAGPSPIESKSSNSLGANTPPGEGLENNFTYTIELENKIVDLIGDRTGRIVPIYPQSEKAQLTTWELAGWVENALERCAPRGIGDPLPGEVRRSFGLVEREQALRGNL